ncbi:MAG: KH domain-containing protein [Candidatus Yanofskybacteria bacterium]|nr:KH domain-containing protein [Candidatus Yanofskybacteria bacterium]
MANFADREFVEYIIKQIVNKPDEVEVTRKVDEMGVLIEVKVNPEDMGLLIGRAGSTAKAIRTLARIIGMRNNARVNLRIVEPEGSPRYSSSEAGSTRAPRAEKTRDVEDVVSDLGM